MAGKSKSTSKEQLRRQATAEAMPDVIAVIRKHGAPAVRRAITQLNRAHLNRVKAQELRSKADALKAAAEELERGV